MKKIRLRGKMILVKMDIYEKLLAEKSLDELLEDARIWKNGREKNEYKVNYEVKRGCKVRIWPKKAEERQNYLQEKIENE